MILNNKSVYFLTKRSPDQNNHQMYVEYYENQTKTRNISRVLHFYRTDTFFRVPCSSSLRIAIIVLHCDNFVIFRHCRLRTVTVCAASDDAST